jgi:serine/threonine protein kinase
LLGKGAFGKVYLAESTRLKQECAIKFISNKKIAEAKVHEELMMNELKAL